MVLKLIREHFAFIGILLVCTVLRLMPLFDYQLTLDELSGLNRTRFDSFSALIQNGVKIDAHPLLIQVFIFCIVKLTGYTTWIIKLPFLLMSLGTLVYAYVFCIRNFSKQSGVFATILFGFSLIFVFYAPIARMYGPGIFFSMALLFYFFEIFFQAQNKVSNYFFLGLFALLSAFNHHINALFALTVCASGLLFLDAANKKKYILTCLATVVCYLPTMPVTLYQLEIGGIGIGGNGWLPVPEIEEIIKFTKVLLGTGKSYLVLLSLLIMAVLLSRNFVLTKKQIFLMTLYLLNYFIIYFYSVYRAPVYQYSAMLFASVAFVIFAASFLEYKNTKVFYCTAGFLAAVLLISTYIRKDYLHQSVKTVFEYQYERTFYYKELYGDKNVYPVFFDADAFMEQIYFDKYKGTFKSTVLSEASINITKEFSQLVAGLSSDYLVMSSSFPACQAVASEYFPYLVENTQTQGINFKVYSRRQDDKFKTVEDDEEIGSSNVFNLGGFKYDTPKGLIEKSSSIFLQVDSLTEFPFGGKAYYYDAVTAEGQVMLLKTRFKLYNRNSGSVSACISVNDKKTNENYHYASKEIADFNIKPDSTVTVYVDNYFGTTHQRLINSTIIGAYIWNKNKDNFILKEFEIRIIDFCPKKWKLWD